MLEFTDPRWETLEGGYRTRFDPRPLLSQLELKSDDEATWSELWDNLHHQGDVGLASYAAVPHLVRIFHDGPSTDWNTYALVALIELMRTEPRNPELPTWLAQDYFDAISQLARIGLTTVAMVDDKETVRSILAIVALWKGLRVYGRLLLNYSEDEITEIAKVVLG